MARKLLAGAVTAAALGFGLGFGLGPALGDVGTVSAAQVQILRSAKIVHRHPVLELAVGDLRPLALLVARRGAVDGKGALLGKNIRLEETIRVTSSPSGVVRWRSPAGLHHGIWFVQVTALETDGVTDCPPQERNCNERWSNVRRLTVGRPKPAG